MEIKENKMGTMPVGKLLISMSIPMMFSMLIQALYNIVDSIFIARVSESALTAVSLAFPLQMLMISFAVGTSVGVNSLLARRLGERRKEEAEKVAGNGIVLLFLTYLAFLIIGICFTDPFMKMFTDDAELITMGNQYLKICMIFSFGIFISIACEKIIQGTGETMVSMLIQLVGAVVNIILDPILIFGLFGIPALGVRGAAIATVIGQIASMIAGIILVRRNKYVKVRFLKARFNPGISKETYKVGLPSIIMQAIGTIMTSAMNLILISFTPTATTVFGAYFKLQSFVFMPIFGLNSGFIPIVGYNFGARNFGRIHRTVKVGILIAVLIMAFGFGIFQLFPQLLLSFFNPSQAMLDIGVVALRSISWSFILAGIQIMLSGVFQGTGDGIYSMICSITRQLVFLIPSSWILGKLFGLDMVWYGFIISEAASLTLSLFFFSKEIKRFKQIEAEPIPSSANDGD
ncbi:MAG: MATE family efflux transporter [Sphaerochaetaceae bacterium]|nr:MATE family efflux transporter [Sphaerochaetaceae bacterium]